MSERPRRPFALLRTSPSFRLLVLASFGSGVGTWLAIVALNVDVLDLTGSGAWLAALNVAAIVPGAFLGLLGGPIVDRVSRKALMVGSDVVRLGVFVALPFVGSAGGIVALALVAGIGDAFFRPAVLAGLPNLVADDELPDANFALQSVQWLTTAAGPLLGGVLVAASGPDLAYFVNAASFGVSALLLARISGALLQSHRSLSRGHLRDLVEGFALVRSSGPLLLVLVVWTIALVANGGVNVSEVVLAKETLHGGAFGYGLMWAASGAGLVLGGSLYARAAARLPVGRLYPGSIALYAGAIGVGSLAPNVWVAAAAMVVSGIGNGAAVVANVTFVQRGAPDRLRGRAFTVIMSVNYLFLAGAMVVSGPLTDRIGARWIWGGCALLLLGTAALAQAMCRRLLTVEPPRVLAESAAG